MYLLNLSYLVMTALKVAIPGPAIRPAQVCPPEGRTVDELQGLRNTFHIQSHFPPDLGPQCLGRFGGCFRSRGVGGFGVGLVVNSRVRRTLNGW
jgi:hypothetical protein